jgi:hypothetical protein
VTDVDEEEDESRNDVAALQDNPIATPTRTPTATAERGDEPGERRLFRALLALTLLPLAVSAVVLFLSVRPGYLPTADHALIELQVRDVGTTRC